MAGEFEEIKLYLRGGLNNSVDPSSIADDELVEAAGIEFRAPRRGIFATPGRVVANATGTLKTIGLNYARFDVNSAKWTAGNSGTNPHHFLLFQKNTASATAISLIGTADDDGVITFEQFSYYAPTNSPRTFSNTATSVIDALGYRGEWYAWNGADRPIATLRPTIDSRSWGYVGLQEATASGTMAASGSGSDFDAGTYEAWWVEVDGNYPVSTTDANFRESANIGTIPSLTISSGQKLVLTLPASGSGGTDSPNGLDAAWYITLPGGKYPNGFRAFPMDTSQSYSPGGSTVVTSIVESLPYRITGPLGGVAVSSDIPPPRAYDMVVYNDSLVAIDGQNRNQVKFSLPGEPNSWPVVNTLDFDTPNNEPLNTLCVVNDLLLVFSGFEVYRLPKLPRHTDPDDLANLRGKIKKKYISGHGCTSPRGAITINTPHTGEICVFACRDGIHATDGQRFWNPIPNIDWPNMVSPDHLDLISIKDNQNKSRVQIYYIDKDDTSAAKRLDIYYHSTLISKSSSGNIRFPVLGPHPSPGLNSTIGILGGEFREWSADTIDGLSRYAVYLEGTGTTDNAQLVDSSGTLNKSWKTKDFYFGGVNADFETEKVFFHQADTTASGSYTVTGTFRTDDDAAFTATATVNQSLKNAQPLHFLNDRSQSVSLRAAKNDTGDLQEVDYIVFVVKARNELASVKSSS